MTSYATAIPVAPEYGPFRRGRDSVAEILDAVNDIATLPPAEWGWHFNDLLSVYPAAAFLDALVHVFGYPSTAPQVRASSDAGPP